MSYRILPLFLLCPLLAAAQVIDREGEFGEDWGGYFWGLRGGLSLGSQDWSNIETELNPGLHADLFFETLPTNARSFAFWGQVGYHQRGSRLQRRQVIFQGTGFQLPADNFQFNNVSLAIGGKQTVSQLGMADLYYLLGIRGEYNVSTNLGEYDQLAGGFRQNYPIDSYEFINRVVYGASAGGGANLLLSPAVGAFVELVVQPDLSFQYNQGRIDNVINPGPGGGNTSLGERAIRNVTIELSVGLRFLRSYRYID